MLERQELHVIYGGRVVSLQSEFAPDRFFFCGLSENIAVIICTCVCPIQFFDHFRDGWGDGDLHTGCKRFIGFYCLKLRNKIDM